MSETTDVSEIVKKVCPFADVPYEEQLERKFKRISDEIEWFMNHKFNRQPKPRIHKCIPSEYTEHYVNTLAVTLLRDEAKEEKIEAGYKFHVKNVPKLIPLRKLVFVPPQFADLVDAFVEWCKSPDGLTVVTSEKVTGHVMGLILQMSCNEEIVLTILVRVPPQEGENSRNAPTNLDALSQKMLDELEEKSTHFMQSVGKRHKVKAIYVKGIVVGAMFSKDSEVILVTGSDVEEPADSDMGLYVEPRCQWSASNRAETKLFEWLMKLSGIDQETIVYVSASSFKYIPFVFAKKAREVVALIFAQTNDAYEALAESIQTEVNARLGKNNIKVVNEYVPADHSSQLKEATLIIWGPLQKWDSLRQMVKDGVKQVLFATKLDSGLIRMLKHFALEGLMPSEVVPIDVMPQCSQIGIVVRFEKAPGTNPQPLDRKPSPTPYKFMEDDDGKQKGNRLKRRGSQMRNDGNMRGPKSRREDGHFRGGRFMGDGMMGGGRGGFRGPRPEPIPLMELMGGGPMVPHRGGPPAPRPLMGGPPPQPLPPHPAPLLPQAPSLNSSPQVQDVLNILNVAQQLAMVKQQNQMSDGQFSANLGDAVAITQLLQQQQTRQPAPVPAPVPLMANTNSWSQEPQPLIPNLATSSGSEQWTRRGAKPFRGGDGGPKGNASYRTDSSSSWGNETEKKRYSNDGYQAGGNQSSDNQWWKGTSYGSGDASQQGVNNQNYNKANAGRNQDWKRRNTYSSNNGNMSDQNTNALRGQGNQRWGGNRGGVGDGQQGGRWNDNRRNNRR